MPDIVIRLAILLFVGAVTWLLITFGRRFVDARRQRVLSTQLPDTLSSVINTDDATGKAIVRILAFSTPDCQQCHQTKFELNRMAKHRFGPGGEKYGEALQVLKVDK